MTESVDDQPQAKPTSRNFDAPSGLLPTDPLNELRRLDYDRYLTCVFAEPVARRHLAQLYLFNAEVAQIPDRVSEPLLGAMRIRWWLDQLPAVFAGDPPKHPAAIGLSAAVRACDLPQPVISGMLESRLMDMDQVPPVNMAAVLDYVDGTAGALGELAGRILGSREPQVLQACRDASRAYGLVGLVRSVPYYARSRRCFLPGDAIRAEGVSMDKLFTGKPETPIRALTEPVLEEAQAVLDGMSTVRPVRAVMPALLLATLAVKQIADLKKRAWDPFRPQPKSGPKTLIRLAWSTWRRRI